MNLIASMRYLVALNEHRHFGRAAQACYITQPALSNALRALEEEFGTAIVKRGRAFVGFTPEGERVLASAQRILREQEMLQQELDSAAGRPQGRLSIGAVPAAMPVAARFATLLQACHPGIRPVLRSMSSPEIEIGIESLSLDIGLGYIDRIDQRQARMDALPQYTEHYFLLRRAAQPARDRLRIAEPTTWMQAAQQALCLLTPEMHYRTIVDSALAMAGAQVQPAIETNCILSLAVTVLDGDLQGILPGALVSAVSGYRELEAAPLVGPDLRTPIGFMVPAGGRPSRTLQAALEFSRDPQWIRHAAAHSGPLVPLPQPAQ
ncbi:MAG: HTH-type transcriptional regulator CynR [Paracidovorax wautersii]|uniref:HTH-type transcriptional regulator CynR n=1 Tax=Paracidovorax wautersii TaxID=1177982 RepID=A0A7V8FQ38_9BURK|nr:MAG: HTH-type transcriptional regulator CynR [Paracidovorax wautersii]